MTHKTDDLCANVRTHVPDFDMATEIMRRVRLSDTIQPLVYALEDLLGWESTAPKEVIDKAKAALARFRGKSK